MKKLIFIIILISASAAAFAQLPKIEVVHASGKNVISWINTYQGLESIDIQRSTDSTKGFITIGNLKKPAKGANSWSDPMPVAGKSFYQLIINFNPEVNWPSNRKSIVLDSATLAIGKNLTIEKAKEAAVEKAKVESPGLIKEEIKPAFTFTPSVHVYTNPYTGHVNISLENTLSKRYSVAFYMPDKSVAFKIDRISIDHLVVDKRNFNGKGVFAFALMENGVEVEKGFVSILQ
jgi:hypothetical protein